MLTETILKLVSDRYDYYLDLYEAKGLDNDRTKEAFVTYMACQIMAEELIGRPLTGNNETRKVEINTALEDYNRKHS